MKKSYLIAILAFVIFIIGIVYFSKPSSIPEKDQAISLCISLCQEAKEIGLNLENGPCLSDNSTKWNLEKWVCDVAHWPRQDVDNKRENQCNKWWEAYLAKKEIHFVEVDPDCNFIRAI